MTTVYVPTAKINMGPMGFFLYSEDFLAAYHAYSPTAPFSPAKCYLVCRSLELSLKAFLSSQGKTVRDIKKEIGHDLGSALDSAKDLGILNAVGISAEDEREIRKANEWYQFKRLEYFAIQNLQDVWNKDTPNLQALAAIAEQLIGHLEPICRASALQP